MKPAPLCQRGTRLTILDKLTCASAGSKAWKLGKWWHKAACKFSTSFASILPKLQVVNGRPGKRAPRDNLHLNPP